MRYDLDDLRLFVHIVAEGSITAGARLMHLSLPSASARVRALEAQAGVALLIRERRGVRPTPAGTTLARHARDVLAQTARLDSAVASYTAAPGAPVVLLAGASAMHRLVPLALTSFLLAYPEHDVTVIEQPTPETRRRLAAGTADLGIVVAESADDRGPEASPNASPDASPDAEPADEPLGDDSLVVIGQAGGLLAGRTEVSYREIAEHPLVGLDLSSSLRQWIDLRLGQAPVARHRTLVPDLHTLVALAAGGVGLAVVPRRAVDPSLPIDVCTLQDQWSRRRHLLCWGVRTRTASVTAFAHHLRLAAGLEMGTARATPPGATGDTGGL
ncbi:LysR family transcriptional regulator [Kribbella deserti]|uniref:LysR family transcriptional regulator n=1 Tax=Kribbella deserti TaxID=1926257 RepID=A0ABV6QX85_9ACTN